MRCLSAMPEIAHTCPDPLSLNGFVFHLARRVPLDMSIYVRLCSTILTHFYTSGTLEQDQAQVVKPGQTRVRLAAHVNVICGSNLGSTRVYIYRYRGKCGISLWIIRYIPQFELAVRHLGINHYCSLSLMSNHFSCLPISHS